jgi:hypothetical protein
VSAQEFQAIVLSHATYVGASGATAAATYAFFTSDYQPPEQPRYIDKDIVKNQNGKFKYLYDNGPGFKRWNPFKVHCENAFSSLLGATAGQQLDNIRALWEHPGVMGMKAPEGTYTVHWGDSIERSFRIFPARPDSPHEHIVVIQLEEGS